MGYAADRQEQIQRNGFNGSGLPLPLRQQIARKASQEANTFGSLDPTIDAQWANTYNETRSLNTYFDYFFSGQDIQVYIDGIDKPDPEAELPILQLAIEIEQMKKPVYGFWSYTFDQVMRGTRIVSGAMVLHTTSTDYMARMLSKAATARANKNAKYAIRGLDKDESLIEQYWGRNINDDSSYSNGRNIFSSHPPFNLVIVYGIQSSSITGNGAAKYNEVIKQYRDDTPLYQDTNERLVATEADNAMRIVLENVELIKMGTQFAPDGTPITETYNFFARDLITPRLDHNLPKKNTGAHMPQIGLDR